MKSCVLLSVTFLLGLELVLAQGPDTAPVSIQVVSSPYAVPNAGQTALVYELLLSDYRTSGLTMKRVEVFADGTLLRTFTEEDLLSEEYTGPAALALPAEDAATDNASASEQPVLYFAIPLGDDTPVPSAISHVIHFVNTAGESAAVTGGAAKLNTDPLMVVGPPLRGNRMAATEAIGPRTHHRRGVCMKDGKVFISQRFAIDWIQLTEKGTMSDGSTTGNASYVGYGADLLAVAPGTVVKVIEGIADNQVPPARDTAITNDTVAGNLVVIQIATNRYAFYGHCIPGSILVEEGDTVAAGQVIAHMGNSGNSDVPHLHFHIADGLALFEAQGVPYAIDRFSHDGDFRYWTSDGDDFVKWTTEFSWSPLKNAERRTSEFLANGMVVTFE